MDRIGVAGLGKMGQAMAGTWAGKGISVTGWTRRGMDSAEADALGIAVAGDLAALAAASDIIVTSLSDDGAVTAVLGALAECDLTGKLVVETSTVSPQTVISLAGAIRAAGGRLIDAPVSGGPEMLRGGVAGIFAGGPAADVARYAPLAAHVSAGLTHAGDLGRGLAMKIVNNMVIAGYIRSLRDALSVGAKSGLALEDMMDALLAGPVANGFLKSRAALILGQEERVGFAAEQILGDMDVFLGEAGRLGVEAPAVEGLRQAAEAAVAAGDGGKDIAVILRDAGRGQ